MNIVEFLAKFFSVIFAFLGAAFIVFKAGEKNGESKEILKQNDFGRRHYPF